MTPPQKTISLKNSKNQRLALRLASLILMASLLLGACRPTPPTAPAPPTNTPAKLQPAASATPQGPAPTPTSSWVDSNLPIVDDGAPLAPQVVEQQPQGGQQLPQDGEITLIFDQDMDQQKTASALKVTDAGGQPISGSISWPSNRSLNFKPDGKLLTNALYSVSVGAQAASAQGASLKDPYHFQFLTTGELQISQVFPADGAKEVTNDAVITVIFNRPVVPLVIAEEQAGLPQPLSIMPEIPGKGEWVNTSVYAYRPDGPLLGGTNYQVNVAAGLQDAAGDTQLAQAYTWQFTTIAPSIDYLALASGEYNPSDNYQNLLLDEAFRFGFNQPMDIPSSEAAISLTSANGERVNLQTRWNEEATSIWLTPTQRLALGASYSLVIDAQAQAASGGTLSNGLTWSFNTVPPPGIRSTSPANGETQANYGRDFTIYFKSPMNIESVKQHIQVSPAPEGEFEWYYNEWGWSMQGYFLQPSTQYQVRLLPGMQDIYGNEIAQETMVNFTTAAYEPWARLQMPYEPAVLRQGGPQEFYASYSNIPDLTLQLYRLSLEEFGGMLSGILSRYDYVPAESSLVWQTQETNNAALNENMLKAFQPSINGEELPPGFYFLALDAPDIYKSGPYVDQRMLVVANANLTFKTAANDTLVWLTDFDSAQPLAGMPVTFYGQTVTSIGEGRTDGNGLVKTSLPTPTDPYDHRYALVESEGVFAFASSNWESGIDLYKYGSWGPYYPATNQPRAYVYTERPIYRPGQPVYFKGILRLDDDLKYSLPDASRVWVTISNYEETVYQEEVPLSEFGSFSGQFDLDSEATLGYYTLDVRLQQESSSVGEVTFNVAEYRKPEFQVSVNAEPADLLNGDTYTVQINASYYSGGNVKDALVDWTLTSAPFNFQPPDEFGGYSFYDYEEDIYYYEAYYEPSSDIIAQGQGRTDASGQLLLTLPADLGDAKASRQFTLEATVTDLAGAVVSGRDNLVVHRSQVYPGVKPREYIGKSGEEQTVDLAALDWDGSPLDGQALTVEIVERRWYSVQKQDATGRVQWESSVEEVPVASFSDIQTDAKGKASVVFTPSSGGVYRARVTALDARGNAGIASVYLWIASDDYIPWRQTNDHSFELIADRKNYTPGDTAEILIASPFQGEAQALVTVERGRIHFTDVVQLTNNSTIYKLPITPAMAPDAFVSVIIMKGIDENNPRPNYKMGMLRLKIATEQQALSIEAQPDRQQAGPGEQVRYAIKVRDYQGNPVSAEVSLSLSDLATLSLMPPNSTPILDYFYAQRDLGVWTAVPLALNIEEYNAAIQKEIPAGQQAGAGGGKGEGDLGVVEVRQDFPDTAFWDAHVVTNQNGEATVAMTLPDNLTTWRLEARAVTQDTLVGQTTDDIISSRPLLVRPQTPRFFVVNDQARLGAAVHNNTDEPLQVQVSLAPEGLTLLSPAEQTVEIGAQSQAYVTWEAVVNADAQRVDLVFSAASGDLKDASRPPQGSLPGQGIPVYRYEAPETVGASGQLTAEGTLVEAISLPASMPVMEGELTIKIAHSLAAGMTDSLTYLESYPYECIEQTISRFLPNVITTRALKSANLADPAMEANLQTQVEGALQRLYNWQNADGGWGWWSSQESNALTSAYVVLGLLEARDAGYTINQDVITRGLDYLRTQVVPLARLNKPEQLNLQSFLLYVLARAGQPDTSSSVRLFDDRQGMALYAHAFLAQTLYLIDPGDERIKTLLSDFNTAAIASATGTHWEEAVSDRWNWNTDTRTTAIVLSALSQIDPLNPLNANAVRWLMSHRTNGHWLGTQETAWSLMGLTNWMVASGELNANYQYAVGLNGERLGGGVANAESLRQTLVLKVDVADLLKAQANRLAFAHDGGPGNLYYTAHLTVDLPVEQIQPLDRGIIVSRSYYRLDGSETPVTEARVGEMLVARLTVIATNALHYVVVDDPLPAGLEAVNQELETSVQNTETSGFTSSWDGGYWRGWGWWSFSHIQLRDERVVLSTDYLSPGTYVYTYLVRAGTAGTFHTIPPTAQEFYFPEVYGRGAGELFTVTP